MSVPTVITDLSTTASSNPPAASESPVDGDNHLRAHAAFIAQLNANKLEKGGTIAATANQPMGGFKHTGAGAGVATGQYLTYGQSNAELGGAVTITATGIDRGLTINQADETGNVPAIYTRNTPAGNAPQFAVYHNGSAIDLGNQRTAALNLFTGGGVALQLTSTANAVFPGNASAASFSGPLTGDVTGNADTASSVAWSGVTGAPAALANAVAGTYTPTGTNVSNVSASTMYEAMYTRIGDVVSVSGTCLCTPTAAGFTQLDISLPIASTVGGTNSVAGVAASISATAGTSPARISAAPVQNRAMVYFYDDNGGSRLMSYQFSYVVI